MPSSRKLSTFITTTRHCVIRASGERHRRIAREISSRARAGNGRIQAGPVVSALKSMFQEGFMFARLVSFGVVLGMAAPVLAADTPANPETFSKDVAPIFQAKCQQCHQPNSIAPMSLITYQDARPWARSIKERVASHQMPPWHIDKTRIASGPNRRRFDDDDLVNRRPQLMEWAIGKGDDLYRPGTGKLMVPGEKIAWDQHIHAVGEEITGGSEVGVWFYKKGEEPKKRSYLVGFTGIDRSKMLDIPPNSMAMTEGFSVLKENAIIENFQPHFHLRGKAMQVEAILPDGGRQTISYVGNFNFNWMTNYIYDDDAAPLLPKGTVIHVSAWYDNTPGNKNNPDPDQWVGYGDRTVDEMAHAWMNVVYFNDQEYKDLQAERKAKLAKTTNDNEKQQ